MADHEQKYCSRCKSAFECKAGMIGQCQCTNIKLNKATVEWIEKKYNDCLCVDCLTQLNSPQQLFIDKFGKSPH
jgi:hypothetical protein